MRWSLALVSIAVVAMVLTSYAEVYACFDPMDRYSIEVVLNKPGVSYDLTPLEKLVEKRVVAKVKPSFGRIEIAYIYRSHIDRRVIVVVSLQLVPKDNDPSSWKRYYLAIRVEPEVEQAASVNQHLLSYYAIAMNTSIKNVESAIKMLRSYGWRVEYERIDDVIRMHLYREIGEFSINVGIGVTTVPGKGKLTVVSISIAFPAKEIRGPDAVKAKEFVLKHGIVDEIARALKILGIDIELSIDEFSYSYIKPDILAYRPKVDLGLLRKIFIYELKWLCRIGVIKGLTEEDIAEIARVAKTGYAGWNSRLVYVEGRGWIPYYEMKGCMLIKGIGCEIQFDPGKIPRIPPLITPTYKTTAIAAVPTTISITISIESPSSTAIAVGFATTAIPTTITKTVTTTKILTTTVPRYITTSIEKTKTVTTTLTETIRAFPELSSIALGLVIGIVLALPAIIALSKRK